MKFTITSLFLFISFSVLYAQESTKDLLCNKKWHNIKIEAAGNVIPVPLNVQKTRWFRFVENGTFEDNFSNYVREGQWTFSKNKDSVHITDSANVRNSFRIVSLSEKNLVMNVTIENKAAQLFFESRE